MSTLSPSRVIVGLSGGVDSAVTALLLKNQGMQVEALFMKNWDEDDDADYCAAAEDLADAEAVCDHLGIPLHKISFSAEYWDRVFKHFLTEYRAGRTPNPDILCNREIKFRAFLDYALSLGADHIATGHYARIDQDSDGRFHLLKGTDANKDQSYFLYTLGQRQLRHSLFPVGAMEKAAVRQIAQQAGFPNHAKKDSTGICFIGERKFSDFLARYLPAQPGNIQTPEGEVLGRHQGLMFYTLGQRQGLGIGGQAEHSDAAWYVAGKDMEHNSLIVVQGGEHPLLYQAALLADAPHWVSGQTPILPLRCTARIRYRQADQACTLKLTTEGDCRIDFDVAQRAITPGQAVVFYQGEDCLGGATITKGLPRN